MILSDLPPEILGQILHFTDVSHQYLNLWQCGSRLLTAKLATGITHVDLKGESGLLTLFPRSLHELRNLQHLSFASNGELQRSLSKSISMLSSTLEALHVYHTYAPHVFLNCAPDWTSTAPKYITSNYGRGDTRLVDISLLFPRLHTLKLFDSNRYAKTSNENLLDLAGLPLSITRLAIDPIWIMDTSICVPALLPPSLRHMESEIRYDMFDVRNVFDSWVTRLPSLETIVLTCGGYKGTAHWLSRSVTKVFGTLKHFTPALASTLPPAYSDLHLNYIDFDAFQQNHQRWPSELPKNLKTLTLELSSRDSDLSDVNQQLCHQIAHLPRSLTSISIVERTDMSWNLAESEDLLWPPSLVSFTHRSTSIPTASLKLLPKTLTSLSIRLEYPSTGSKVVIDSNVFSPKLTDLAITLPLDAKIVEIDNELPQSLTTLAVMNWTRQVGINLKSLKRFKTLKNLTSLRVQINTDELLNTQYASEMPLPPHLTHLTLNVWSARWFSSIPRSVTDLTIVQLEGMDSTPDMPGRFLHELPTGLTDLELRYKSKLPGIGAAFPDGALPHLPHLRILNIMSIGHFTSSNMRSLPALLKRLAITFISINECDAPYFPQRLTHSGIKVFGTYKPYMAQYWSVYDRFCPMAMDQVFVERLTKEKSRLISNYYSRPEIVSTLR